MIEIDGSYGEGGGQVLRTSISLSAVMMRPVKIINIRAGRSKPGLRRQHLAGIAMCSQMVNAEVLGLEVGSTDVTFIPRERRGGVFSYDVGTAGSISLILQAVLPPAVLCPEPVHLHLNGGTDVSWSPPIDYLKNVFSHALNLMGPQIDIQQKQRGHYPKGGGIVTCSVSPVEKMLPLDSVEFGKLKSVNGISHCVRLPEHVAERQAASAEKVLHEHKIDSIHIDRESYQKQTDPHRGPGSGVVLWAESEFGFRLGADRLGSRGKRAEIVGSEAAVQLLDELSTGKAIDSHLCDMLIPYLAMASGNSKIGITKVTSHLSTNIWVAESILGSNNMKLEGEIGSSGILVVKGLGLSL